MSGPALLAYFPPVASHKVDVGTLEYVLYLSLCCLQIGEQETFISELLNDLTLTIQDLETHQIHMFYEAVGLMIGADANPDKQRHYLVRASSVPLTFTCYCLSCLRACCTAQPHCLQHET